ncbi:hypothetical protein CHS0354_036668, partial [Potamilus streckersoni]
MEISDRIDREMEVHVRLRLTAYLPILTGRRNDITFPVLNMVRRLQSNDGPPPT